MADPTPLTLVHVWLGLILPAFLSGFGIAMGIGYRRERKHIERLLERLKVK